MIKIFFVTPYMSSDADGFFRNIVFKNSSTLLFTPGFSGDHCLAFLPERLEKSLFHLAWDNACGCGSFTQYAHFLPGPLQYQFSFAAHLLGDGNLRSSLIFQRYTQDHRGRIALSHAHRLDRFPVTPYAFLINNLGSLSVLHSRFFLFFAKKKKSSIQAGLRQAISIHFLAFTIL